jgi:hypothetical protein
MVKKTHLSWEKRLHADQANSRPFAGHPPSYKELSDVLAVLVHNRPLSKDHHKIFQNLVMEAMNKETEATGRRPTAWATWVAGEAVRLVIKKIGPDRINPGKSVLAVIGEDTQDFERVEQAYKKIKSGKAKTLIFVTEDDWIFTEALARAKAMINQ